MVSDRPAPADTALESPRHRSWPLLGGVVLLAIATIVNPWTIATLLSPDGTIENRAFVIGIAAVTLALFAAGLWLIVRRPAMTNAEAIAMAVSGLLIIGAAELAMRLAYRQDDLWFATMRRSPTLGWETRPEFSLVREMGNYGVVHYTTDALGFRRFGSAESTGPRVLVLGDSFTEAAQVSDGGTYFDYLADSAGLEVEVFAYGASAYGSLQEYLVLDRVIDEIRPDLILWQFCSNDLLNNYRPLEARSLYENSWWRRPYLENGEIVVRAPSLRGASQVSAIAMFLESRRALVHAERATAGVTTVRSIESLLSPDHPLLRESVEVTSEIMRRVRERAGGVPVVAFSVNRPDWLGDAFAEVAAAAGIRYIDGIPETVAARKEAGLVVDGITNLHWNAVGHGIAGRMLADTLVAWGLLPSPAAREHRALAQRPQGSPARP